ncbi:MAG: DinB family protein [Acidimicrobiia bacterium]
MDECDECGLVYAAISIADIPTALSEFGTAYRARLHADPDVLRARPSPEVWSALEYACHVRDVLEVQRTRLALALVEARPTFVPMGREERLTRDRYNEQQPGMVADQLDLAANAIAAAFSNLTAEQWERTGIYNWPTPTERTMAWLGRHTIHEGRHHLRDIDDGLGRVTA